MLITIKEYAAKVGRSPVTIRQRAQRGAIPAVKIGRDWLIEEDTPLVDGRVSSGKYVGWRQKYGKTRKNQKKVLTLSTMSDIFISDGEGNTQQGGKRND